MFYYCTTWCTILYSCIIYYQHASPHARAQGVQGGCPRDVETFLWAFDKTTSPSLDASSTHLTSAIVAWAPGASLSISDSHVHRLFFRSSHGILEPGILHCLNLKDTPQRLKAPESGSIFRDWIHLTTHTGRVNMGRVKACVWTEATFLSISTCMQTPSACAQSVNISATSVNTSHPVANASTYLQNMSNYSSVAAPTFTPPMLLL